jgi:hypothetical protein
MGSYEDFHDELLRHMADAMGLTYEQLLEQRMSGKTNFYSGGRRYGRSYAQDQAQRMANMKEINPEARRRDSKPPVSEDVAIEHSEAERAYWVSLPRRGRLGDRRLYDGETGKPLDIGPRHDRPAEFTKISDALAHFKRVADAFERLT